MNSQSVDNAPRPRYATLEWRLCSVISWIRVRYWVDPCDGYRRGWPVIPWAITKTGSFNDRLCFRSSYAQRSREEELHGVAKSKDRQDKGFSRIQLAARPYREESNIIRGIKMTQTPGIHQTNQRSLESPACLQLNC